MRYELFPNYVPPLSPSASKSKEVMSPSSYGSAANAKAPSEARRREAPERRGGWGLANLCIFMLFLR